MPRPTDVADLASLAAADGPDRLALVEAGGRSLTWSGLDDQVSRVATGLGAHGVVGGNRVVLVLGNRIEFVTTYLGILRAHAVAVPVNPRSKVEELAWMIADCGARAVVGDAGTASLVREAVTLLRTVLGGAHVPGLEAVEAEVVARAVDPQVILVGVDTESDETSYDELVHREPATLPPVPETERLAVLLYTLSPGGRPRAAMLTHRALLANIRQVAELDPPMMHGDDVVLAVLPLFHVYALNGVLGQALWHGAKVVLVERFHPEATLDVIDDEAVSVLPLAPPVFDHWSGHADLRERLGPVRLVLSGSASLRPEASERFTAETGLVVHQGYGLTEGAPVVTTTLHSTSPTPGSFGAPVPGVEVSVVDGRTRTPELHDPGLVRVRGENLFSGYWPDGADGPDADGWWDTGDVGFLDEHGDLHLVDRVDDTVVVSGFTVYPVEVERVVGAVEGVAECAVIGVEDEQSGQAVVAYLVLEPGAGAEQVRSAVEQRAVEQLARFKRPSRVEVVETLPTYATGEVARGRVRGIERRRALGLVE